MELEYSDSEPFDLNNDAHRDYVVQRFADAEGRIHERTFYASAHIVLGFVIEKMERLRDVRIAEAVLRNWAKEHREDKTAKLRQSLERQLAPFAEKEAALEKRVAAAFDMVAEGGPGANEAKRLIAKAEGEHMALEAQRSTDAKTRAASVCTNGSVLGARPPI